MSVLVGNLEENNGSSCVVDYVNQISVDWLRFSFEAEAWMAACYLFDISNQSQDWMEKRRYFRPYMSMPMDGVTVAAYEIPYRGKMRERFIVDLSGNGLGIFFSRKPWLRLETLLQECYALPGARVLRLDVAFDDHLKLLHVPKLVKMCKEAKETNRIITNLRRFVRTESGQIGHCDEYGDTLSLGSRDGDTYIRVYDKRQQELYRGAEPEVLPAHWVRFELEYKNEMADWITHTAISKGFHPYYFCQTLRGVIDFREGTRRPGQRKDRLPIARWWRKFLGNVEVMPIRVARPIASIERKVGWLEKSVAPTLALIKQYYDDDMAFFYHLLHNGQSRLTPQHLALLNTVMEGM